MSFACLLIAAATAGEVPDYAPEYPSDTAVAEYVPEYVPLNKFSTSFEPPILSTEDAAERLDAGTSTSPWLSARERWCRSQVTSSVALLDVLTLYAEIDGCSGGQLFGIGSIQPERRTKSSPPSYAWNPTFVALLFQSLEIRTSDRSPYDKGRRLARLVKPWMTWAQIHALFGESDAVAWDHGASHVVYRDYGVCIDRGRRVICRDDSPEAKGITWDCFSQPREDECEQVFNFFIGFMR